MLEIILTVGLPASGKTTWANEFITSHKDFVNINRDDLRLMLWGRAQYNKFSKEKETIISNVVKNAVDAAINTNKSVILSDTNLNPIYNEQWKLYAVEKNIEYKEQLFIDVPLGVCLERDQRREYPVGQRVIESMFTRYRDVWWPKPKFDVNLPNAYLVDLDGTLANMGTRSPYDWTKVFSDTVNQNVLAVVNQLSKTKGTSIIVLSGRDSRCRDDTIRWLRSHSVMFHDLFMRPEGDTRADYVVKKELYLENIKGLYNVLGVFDDRNQVVHLWRHLGLTCFQVGYGWF